MAIIRLSPDTFFSTDDGVVITEQQAQRMIQTAVLREKNLTVSDSVAKVIGRDQVVLDFSLKGINADVPPTDGFLVTFYLSSSAGLQRMYKNPIIDPADQSLIRGSYADYIDVEFDV